MVAGDREVFTRSQNIGDESSQMAAWANLNKGSDAVGVELFNRLPESNLGSPLVGG